MNPQPTPSNKSHQILLISPYHGGSHRAWAEGYQAHSQYQIDLLTLPDRFWKWRMHGGAVTLARRFLEGSAFPDLILATDMLDLTTFLSLTRSVTSQTPTLLYMHENQLTYPLPSDGRTGPMRRQLGERDQHYAFLNYASMLAADAVLFNSQFHLESFFASLPHFLKHFPEYNEIGTLAGLRAKSSVLPVGVDFGKLGPGHPFLPDPEFPLIIWNQRWEFDKNPEAFFQALYRVAEAGIPFRLALCGQQFGKRPSIFEEALIRLEKQIIHIGQANPAKYRQLLWQAAVTLSTARHEFFGISILEAIFCRTFPLLPRRLSYPELIPSRFHDACFYGDEDDLHQRLCQALLEPEERNRLASQLATAVTAFNWSQIAPLYDAVAREWIHPR